MDDLFTKAIEARQAGDIPRSYRIFTAGMLKHGFQDLLDETKHSRIFDSAVAELDDDAVIELLSR